MAKPMGGQKNLPTGKALTANITRGLQTKSALSCADNTGAKELEIISVHGYKGVRRRQPNAGVGDLIICSVKKGRQDMRRQVVNAVIIRQRQPYTRYNGAKISFEDNAAVIVGEDGFPKGTEIKGAVAREAAERWNKIGTIANTVI